MVICGPNDEVPASLLEFTRATMMCVLGMWVSVVDSTEEALDTLIGRAWGVYHSVKKAALAEVTAHQLSYSSSGVGCRRSAALCLGRHEPPPGPMAETQHPPDDVGHPHEHPTAGGVRPVIGVAHRMPTGCLPPLAKVLCAAMGRTTGWGPPSAPRACEPPP